MKGQPWVVLGTLAALGLAGCGGGEEAPKRSAGDYERVRAETAAAAYQNGYTASREGAKSIADARVRLLAASDEGNADQLPAAKALGKLFVEGRLTFRFLGTGERNAEGLSTLLEGTSTRACRAAFAEAMASFADVAPDLALKERISSRDMLGTIGELGRQQKRCP